MPIVDAKQAIELARQHLKEFFPEAEMERLEELEQTESDSSWRITLSYLVPNPQQGLLASSPRMAAVLAPETMRREYKVFEIHPQDGSLVAMRMRKV
jgi:hypothetical protein